SRQDPRRRFGSADRPRRRSALDHGGLVSASPRGRPPRDCSFRFDDVFRQGRDRPDSRQGRRGNSGQGFSQHSSGTLLAGRAWPVLAARQREARIPIRAPAANKEPADKAAGSRTLIRLDLGSVPSVATAMSTTAAMSATGTTSARMTSRPSAWPANRAVPWTRPGMSNSRPRPWAANHMAAMMPAAPTGATTPTKSATPGVAAPIEARPAPATVVPAILAAEINKLG